MLLLPSAVELGARLAVWTELEKIPFVVDVAGEIIEVSPSSVEEVVDRYVVFVPSIVLSGSSGETLDVSCALGLGEYALVELSTVGEA